jgi:catechol 2,3-dioxygenase-like lactoylglutathione lyase family enzyme
MTAARGIDHLVIALKDLDAGARFYERLGFQVGARNRHPWGTENRLVQFDGSFLELITVGDGAAIPPHGPGAFSFGAFVGDFLARREGLAMLVLDSQDAEADARRFDQSGLGSHRPFRFERSARRPDGGETKVAFTLAFTEPQPEIDAAFFVCQQHYPENFWSPAYQIHPNGAEGVGPVTVRSSAPQVSLRFLETFSESAGEARDGRWRVPLTRGSIVIAEREACLRDRVRAEPFEPGEIISIRVPNIDPVTAILQRNEIPYAVHKDGVLVGPEAAFGVAIVFETS